MLHRSQAVFRQSELQCFAENCRVSAIFAPRSLLRGTGAAPCASPMISVLSSLFASMADLASGARLIESRAAFAASFCERRLLPPIEPLRPPSKGAQKRLLAEVLLPRQSVGRPRAPTLTSTPCRHEWRHRTLQTRATSGWLALMRACATGASVVGRVIHVLSCFHLQFSRQRQGFREASACRR